MMNATTSDTTDRSLSRIALFVPLLFIGVVITFCYFASSICITVMASAFVAILVDPLVAGMETWRLGRPISAALIILAGAILMGLLAIGGYRKANDFGAELPLYSSRIRLALNPVIRKFERVRKTAASIAPQDSTRRVPEVKIRQAPDWPGFMFRGFDSISESLVVIAVVPFLSFFMLIKKQQMYSWFTSVVQGRIDVDLFIGRLNRMVRGFVVGNLIIGLIMAGITSFTFAVLGINNPIPLGIIVGILNLIPFLGLVLAIAAGCAAALVQFSAISTFLVIIAVTVLLHLIAANMLVPRLIGSRVSLGPVAVTVGMLFWGWLWGIFGLLLAVPLTAFVKLIAETQPALVPVASILAESPRKARDERDKVASYLGFAHSLKRKNP